MLEGIAQRQNAGVAGGKRGGGGPEQQRQRAIGGTDDEGDAVGIAIYHCAVPGRGQWFRDGRLDRLHPIVELAALEGDLADRGLCLEDDSSEAVLKSDFTASCNSASFSL